MKLISLILSLMLIFTGVTGCSQDSNKQPSEEPTQQNTLTEVDIDQFFDYEKQHRPSEANILAIKEGMHITEVFEILGKPHAVLEFNVLTLVWESTKGQSYTLKFWPEDENLTSFDQQMLHSFVIAEAKLWSADKAAEPTNPTIA